MRSGSVFTELPGKPGSVPQIAEPDSGVPENLCAALNTAKELLTSADGKALDKMSTLHALYMQIRCGDCDSASKAAQSDLSEEVLREWRLLSGVSRETLYFRFAKELASQNV